MNEQPTTLGQAKGSALVALAKRFPFASIEVSRHPDGTTYSLIWFGGTYERHRRICEYFDNAKTVEEVKKALEKCLWLCGR